MRKVLLFGLIATAALLSIAAPQRASAAKDPGVLRTGKCSGPTTWKLKAKREDAGFETEFEVDQNRVGRRWNVVLRRNGVVVFRGVRRTVAPERVVRGAEDPAWRRPDRRDREGALDRRDLQGLAVDLTA